MPLHGLRVIELAGIGPVPFAGRQLRQLGAEVILVTPPVRRDAGIPMAADPLEAGKQRLSFDLKSAGGHAALLDLVDGSDALIEGFRPGTLERLGLAPPVLLGRRATLVVGRCGGWGADSPRAAFAGHDINYLALSGVLGAVGPAEQPVPPLNLVGDFGGAAMHLALGVVAAMLSARQTGQGSVVSTSILEATVSLTAHLHGLIDAGLWAQPRAANVLDGGAPFYRCYRTSDGRWLAVGAIEAGFYARLLDHIGARLDASRQHDRDYWPQMEAEIGRCIATRTRDEWDAVLAWTDACASPVLDWQEARTHPHLAFVMDADGPGPAIHVERPVLK